MQRLLAIVLLVLTLAGCAMRPALPPESTSEAPSSQPSPSDAATARTVLAVIGTPFFFLFKTVVCVTSAVIAAPSAAILALVEEPYRQQKRRELDDAFARNCSSPYVLD